MATVEQREETRVESTRSIGQPGRGMVVPRVFSTEGVDSFDQVEWAERSAAIKDEKGRVIFEQTGVEVPASWSQLATNVVVSKYFYGEVGSEERESSVRQLVHRVTRTIADWGKADGYFASDADAEAFFDELSSLCVNQYGSFNSPVWFNVGLYHQRGIKGAANNYRWDEETRTVARVDDAYKYPQGSACFIQSVSDDMEGIMGLAHAEAMLFKYGSGTGTDLSTLRSSREKLSGGGKPSGPVSFMRVYDAVASVVKSGGKTRRAAKMQTLKVRHPDILEFITAKTNEERKANALIRQGYDANFNGEAYSSVLFQNANFSVRATDAFLRAAVNDEEWTTRAVTTGRPMDTYRAKDLLDKVAEGTWTCGDPGLQYEDTIQHWHTCPNTAPINSSNPCCVTGDTLIAVADGRNAVPIRELVGQVVDVYAWDHKAGRTTIAPMDHIEVKRRDARVFRVTLDDGSSFRATDDHLIMLRDGSYRQVKDLDAGDSLNPFHSRIREPHRTRTKRRFVYTGRGWRVQYRWIWEANHGKQPEGFHIHHRDFKSLNDRLDNLELMTEAEHQSLHRDHMLGDNNPARRCMSEQWRARLSEVTAGEKNPNYGKTHDEPTRGRMRAASARRWADAGQRDRSSAIATRWMDEARAAGRPIGRWPGPRFERCCPACRRNFSTPRAEQIFCSRDCRYSPLGREMIGAKGGASRRGRSPSIEHREKLRASSVAAARPEDKRRAAAESLRSRCLKAARLLLDAGHEIDLDRWDNLRPVARALGAAHVPLRASVDRFFDTVDDLNEHAALYNHKVVSVEFDGVEDVFDGTVDGHHNFAIVTSKAPSIAGAEEPDLSGCFIHNSEYMFLDDSACNLSSINLLKFRRHDGIFDADRFRAACRIFITAQEILVDHVSYPTSKITENSHKFRPLGLGYANLGALIMASGRPYDSPEGRALAGAITAIMHGEAYRTSAMHAGRLGPFEGFPINREPMLRVMEMHRDAVEAIDPSCPAPLLAESRKVWDECLELGRAHGYRNSQVTVIAPTGTIAFMMDCDTTGIEPDIALVKYKSLAGGGMLKIVNQTVPMALRTLGYDEPMIRGTLDYIDEHDTIEGAPGLLDDHLAVFDCAFPPRNGSRSIHWHGHVGMMAAAQPFLSGAISKTVNMPREATVGDIREAYLEGWTLGLKALAIYRDGSKESQPVSTSSMEQKAAAELAKAKTDVEKAWNEINAAREALEADRRRVAAPAAPTPANLGGRPAEVGPPRRERLPDTRRSMTHKFDIQGHEGYINVGFYDDGRPGELFITMAKEGSTVGGLMDVVGTLVSMGLQYGVPLEVFVNKFAHSRFEPAGFTKNPEIPIAKSVTDYIFRWLGIQFIAGYREANTPRRDDGPAAPTPIASPTPAALAAPDLDDPSRPAAPMIKTNGHRTASMRDLEEAEATGSHRPAVHEPTVPHTLGPDAQQQDFARFQSDAPSCDNCGALTVRCGTCYRCFNCGNSMGCS